MKLTAALSKLLAKFKEFIDKQPKNKTEDLVACMNTVQFQWVEGRGLELIAPDLPKSGAVLPL